MPASSVGTYWITKRLTPTHILAAQYLAAGMRTNVVALRVGVRAETVTRWKASAEFRALVVQLQQRLCERITKRVVEKAAEQFRLAMFAPRQRRRRSSDTPLPESVRPVTMLPRSQPPPSPTSSRPQRPTRSDADVELMIQRALIERARRGELV